MTARKQWSRGRLQSERCCPACGVEGAVRARFAREDNEGALPDIWSMKQCAHCGSIWLAERPDDASLHLAYNDYYTHVPESEQTAQGGVGTLATGLVNGYLNRRFGTRRQPAHAAGALLFSLIEPWRLKLDYYGRHFDRLDFNKRRLLDIGCGNGAFLSRAAEMGWNSMGCEPDPKAALACQATGLNVIAGDAFTPLLDKERFDVVTMSHVIEHVTDAPGVLRRVMTLLRPGGWLWMALPNPASLGVRVFGKAWHGLHPPYHLCIPSQAVVLSWLGGVGFTNPRLLRRGAHARSGWATSRRIAEAIHHPLPGGLLAFRMLSDALASISPQWGEETVVIAQKPSGAPDE